MWNVKCVMCRGKNGGLSQLLDYTLHLAHNTKDRRGFILPLAVLLVVILTISGTAFMQHDYLERRMAMNTVDNHGGFYLANAGIERARETFKIPDDQTWTTVLNGTYDGPINPGPDYPVDPSPEFGALGLCGQDTTSGCVIPSFGALVNSDIPFGGTFDDGQYEVRAFNNEPGKTDTDQILTYRARGTVRGEKKLIEIQAKAVSGLDLVNCQGDPGAPCPNVAHGNPGQYLQPADGREPDSHPLLPSLPPLIDPNNPSQCNPANFYCDANHFNNPLQAPYVTQSITLGSGMTLSSQTTSGNNVKIQNNTFYLVTGDVTVSDISVNHDVVIYSLGQVHVSSPQVTITNTILIGATGIRFNGDLSINATTPPAPYPAIISQGDIIQASASITIYGNIFASSPLDPSDPAYVPLTVNLNPIKIHGIVIGDIVETQGGAGTLYTDDHATDPNYLKYYVLMPGFKYPQDLKTTVAAVGSWRELQ